jgi:hypothetical protein
LFCAKLNPSHELFRHASVTTSESVSCSGTSSKSMSPTTDLFQGVCYHISPSLQHNRISELSHVLDINGAKPAKSIVDSTLTHLITNSNRFEGWQDISGREEAGELSVVTVRINL